MSGMLNALYGAALDFRWGARQQLWKAAVSGNADLLIRAKEIVDDCEHDVAELRAIIRKLALRG